jgi:hypothetical protein
MKISIRWYPTRILYDVFSHSEIEVTSFDTINEEMNRIQEEVILVTPNFFNALDQED